MVQDEVSIMVRNNNKAQILWLLATCFLVWLMIMLGGATRLTHAGLSIVEWKPITGIIPPIGEIAWQVEFDKYKLFPEYQLVNNGMTLAQFQFIYWMEYAHRLLGRLIGLVFALPLLYFAIRGKLSSLLKKRAIIVGILGMAQGFMGWYMVKSGLVKDPAVSHYRLTVHLMLAVVLFSILLWTAFDLMKGQSTKRTSLSKLATIGCWLLGVTITYGGFVAGLKAGLIYNTFPFMEGHFLPGEWLDYSPLWRNFVENAATVQWIHRWLAIITYLFVLHTCAKIIRRTNYSELKSAAILWISATTLQVILGITTLLYLVPVSLGTLHQGTAIVALAAGLWTLKLTRHAH